MTFTCGICGGAQDLRDETIDREAICQPCYELMQEFLSDDEEILAPEATLQAGLGPTPSISDNH